MQTFDFQQKCQWTGQPFSQGDQAMLCLNCERVMKINSYQKRKRPGEQLCHCNNPNIVQAVASVSTERTRIELNQSSSSVITSSAGGNPLNFRDTISNTPPRNPQPSILNQPLTNFNASSNVRTSSAGGNLLDFRDTISNTPPRNPQPPTVSQPRTNSNTSSNSNTNPWKWILLVFSLEFILWWVATQLNQSPNNSTNQSSSTQNLPPQFNPQEAQKVITRYYQLAPSNRVEANALLSDAFQEYNKQKNSNSDQATKFWNSIERVETYASKPDNQLSNNHQIKVGLKYTSKDGKTSCETQIMEFAFDKSKGQWLIDKVSDVKYPDCGDKDWFKSY